MLYTEPLTLFHMEQNGTVSRFVLRGSWYEGNAAAMAANGSLQPQRVVKVRIEALSCNGFVPAKSYAGTGWTAKHGDYIVRGNVLFGIKDEKGQRFADIPRQFDHVGCIRDVRDRRVGVEPHIYIEGA